MKVLNTTERYTQKMGKVVSCILPQFKCFLIDHLEVCILLAGVGTRHAGGGELGGQERKTSSYLMKGMRGPPAVLERRRA